MVDYTIKYKIGYRRNRKEESKMKQYKVLRFNLKLKMGIQNSVDGVQALEEKLNSLAEEGYELKMLLESVDDLKINHALILEKEKA